MITCYFGAMNSGKSAKLIQDRYAYVQKNVDVWVIKPAIDRTAEPIVQSRTGISCPATIMKDIKWEDIIKTREFYSKVYMIDEVQFFKPKDIDSLIVLSDRYDRDIRTFGLLTDTKEKLFPSSKKLIESGCRIVYLDSPCQMVGCMNLATHHLRYDPRGFIIKDGKSVVVDDGQVVYKSVCRQCYDREMHKSR